MPELHNIKIKNRDSVKAGHVRKDHGETSAWRQEIQNHLVASTHDIILAIVMRPSFAKMQCVKSKTKLGLHVHRGRFALLAD